MFPSLALLRHIFKSPILRNEIAYLRNYTHNRNPWLQRAGYILIAFASIMASLPLWIYITDDFPTYLLLPPMVVAIYGVQLMVGARTLILAAHIANRERQFGMWDSLVLTGIDARQIVLSKWCAVMLHVWQGHVVAALLRAGLAYGLAQFFTVVNYGGCYKYFGSMLCFNYGFSYVQTTGNYPDFPSVNVLGLGLVILVVYALLEGGLLTALGIFGPLITGEHRNVGLPIAGGIRVALILLAISSWFFIDRSGYKIGNQLIEPFINMGTYRHPYSQMPYPRYQNWIFTTTTELISSLQLTLSTLADSGTVAATELMRPYALPIRVLRRLVVLACGLGMYLVLMSLSLRQAERFMIRRGALRPVDP